jgi:GNAT superfamily N-acetyltransferase
MMRSDVIRPVEAHELPAVALLRWNWLVGESGAVPEVPKADFVAQFVDWAVAHSPTHRCFVADRNGDLVGMAWLAGTDRVPSPRALVRSSADLQSVYVLPEHRNAGVGTRLIEAATEFAAQLGSERVTVHSSDDAIAAYTRAGFSSSERLRQRKL